MALQTNEYDSYMINGEKKILLIQDKKISQGWEQDLTTKAKGGNEMGTLVLSISKIVL